MGKYLDLDVADNTIGIAALRRIAADGPARQSLGIILDTTGRVEQGFAWHPVDRDGARIGDMTNVVYSWRLQRTIGFGLVSSAYGVGDWVWVTIDGARQSCMLCDIPFV